MAAPSGRSAPGGEADENDAKADVPVGMSADIVAETESLIRDWESNS